MPMFSNVSARMFCVFVQLAELVQSLADFVNFFTCLEETECLVSIRTKQWIHYPLQEPASCVGCLEHPDLINGYGKSMVAIDLRA
jgi:hypothetical protein